MNNLKKGILFAALFSSLFFVGCSHDDDDDDLVGNWVKKSAFDGPARSSATSFVIGDYAYVAAGYTGDVYLKDLWAYNSNGDYWEQKADFTGVGRSSASSFQVGGKAYFGTGYDGNYLKDFYQYDDQANTWTLVNGFSGNKRRNATVFVIDTKAYLVTGINNGVYQEDFWEFDPSTDVWTRKRDVDKDTADDPTYNDDYAIVRANASSFSMNGLGYIVGGESIKTVWEYTPSTDLWTERTPMEGATRADAVGFAINNRGFYMLGRIGSTYFDDAWEFKPLDAQNDDDN